MEAERPAAAVDADAPPGWSYNPSSWRERMPILVIGAIGFVLAAYLALYQYRGVATVGKPFFGRGSEIILNSPTSQFFPVSDVALGRSGTCSTRRRERSAPDAGP